MTTVAERTTECEVCGAPHHNSTHAQYIHGLALQARDNHDFQFFADKLENYQLRTALAKQKRAP